MEILQVAAGVAILALPVIGLIWMLRRASRRREAISNAYRAFADRYGLRFASPMPFPMLEGQVDGRKLVLGNFRHPKNPQVFEFRMALGLRGFDADTIITRKGLLDTSDVNTGDAWFDKKVVVKTKYVDAVRAYLLPDRIAAIREVVEAGLGSGIIGGQILLQGQKDYRASAEWFEANLAKLRQWAARLDAA